MILSLSNISCHNLKHFTIDVVWFAGPFVGFSWTRSVMPSTILENSFMSVVFHVVNFLFSSTDARIGIFSHA